MVNLRHLIESQLKSANSELEPKRKVWVKYINEVVSIKKMIGNMAQEKVN